MELSRFLCRGVKNTAQGSSAVAVLSARSALQWGCSSVLLMDFSSCFFGGGFLTPSMWRRISMVGVLLCGAHKIPAVMLYRGHLSSLKTPSFSLSVWSECWELQLGKRAANRSSSSLWPSWNLEVTANELEKKKPKLIISEPVVSSLRVKAGAIPC